MITNGRTGLLFDSNNDKELAEKMLWAINNQDNSKTIIQQAHQAVGEYRWDNVKEKLYTAYGIPS